MPNYSVETCSDLENDFYKLKLHRPKRYSRYDTGKELNYQISSIDNIYKADARLIIQKFVGGGFAGQVYKVKLQALTGQTEGFNELQVGKSYAVKVLIPPSGFSNFFRNLIYWIGFQGPFQPQVNPAAARAGAIWQKLIRQAATNRFSDNNCVVDIYGLFIDNKLGSCGEISEWIDGRTWWLEVDDRINFLSKNKKRKLDQDNQGSPEFRSKYRFMKDFVTLLHDIGAPEFARQYEWSTMKSQPNCLKRYSTKNFPEKGLVAVDFRAGLALLPFLPMSPGDFKLIIKGLRRGSLVQFDRGNISKLKIFIQNNFQPSQELDILIRELIHNEDIYRNSVPDITHNHFRIFFSSKLWSNIFRSSRTGWKIRNLIDERAEQKLSKNYILMSFFYILSFIPFVGKFLIKLMGMTCWRKHYTEILTKFSYFRKALKGIIIERLIKWHRDERINQEITQRILHSFFLFLVHLLLSILPSRLHKFLSDKVFFKKKLYTIFVRPIRLYFDPDLRESWLRDMVDEGISKHMLSPDDAETILEQVNEPFIQKYLKSLAVHVCTIPITQVVSVFLAFLFVLTHPEMPKAQAWSIGVGIIALFQIIPISPGSLVRGLYVVYLVIKERNFKDYNIAVFLGFFKYIGYLAFPIQMTNRYPALARFMAGHWATEAVHIIPVFGERGALLEHWIFGLFYNWPLTIRRQMSERAEIRKTLPPRYWHIPPILLITSAVFFLTDNLYLVQFDSLPGIRSIWWIAIIIPYISGSLLTLGYRGIFLSKRIVLSTFSGIIVGLIYSASSYKLGFNENIIVELLWRCFIFAIFSTVGCMLTELKLGENK